MMDKSATFSSCRTYRYTLSRIWIKRKPLCLFVCLNPSTADENIDDPTVRRCISFADTHRCGGMVLVNLFAFRSKNPNNLAHADDPVGPENDRHIKEMSAESGLTIIAWGAHKAAKDRPEQVLPLLKDPHYLALTKYGMPRHPLFLRKNLRATVFKQAMQSGF